MPIKRVFFSVLIIFCIYLLLFFLQFISIKTVRIVCISDTHDRLGEILQFIPSGDILIHSGDFTYLGKPHSLINFNKDISKLKYRFKYIIVIAGNHEITLDREWYLKTGYKRTDNFTYSEKETRDLIINSKDYIYLEDNGIELFNNKLKIWGSPRQPTYNN